jgi:hypothetical protein
MMDRTAPSCQKHWNADSVVFIRLYLDWVFFFFFFCFLSPPSSTHFFTPILPLLSGRTNSYAKRSNSWLVILL